jgi:hypothetical protein
VIERVGDLVHGMTEARVKSNERQVHEALAGIVGNLPQIQSLLLISKTGHPLASAARYPVSAGRAGNSGFFITVIVNGRSRPGRPTSVYGTRQ